jgi:hypothetical protein
MEDLDLHDIEALSAFAFVVYPAIRVLLYTEYLAEILFPTLFLRLELFSQIPRMLS